MSNNGEFEVHLDTPIQWIIMHFLHCAMFPSCPGIVIKAQSWWTEVLSTLQFLKRTTNKPPITGSRLLPLWLNNEKNQPYSKCHPPPQSPLFPTPQCLSKEGKEDQESLAFVSSICDKNLFPPFPLGKKKVIYPPQKTSDEGKWFLEKHLERLGKPGRRKDWHCFP